MKKHLRWTALLAASSLIFFSLGCPDDNDDPDPDLTEFSVELAGENQVPSVATTGTGEMDVELDNNTLMVEGSFDNLVSRLTDIDGSPAHLHIGSSEESGPVLFNVDVDAGADDRSGTFSFEQELTDDEVNVLESNDLYLNIHTNAYPGGEVRGQLDSEAPEFAGIDESRGLSFDTDFHPHDVDTDADGWAWVILRDDDTMVVSGAVDNLTSDLVEFDGSAVNIEQAATGETGPVIFNLDYEEIDDNGVRFWFDTNLDATQIEVFEDGEYYINIYTDEYAEDGEIRAQIGEEDGFFEDLWEDIFGDDPAQVGEAPPF